MYRHYLSLAGGRISSVSPEISVVCRQHLQFMKWADDLLLDAIEVNLPSRREIMEHIFMAERIWLARIKGNVDSKHLAPPEIHEQWLTLEDDWTRVVEYKTLAGIEGKSPVWQIVLHVVNHGSYHRGQAAAALRAAGFTPPGTDLIAWYRTL
jgi:uncharacterized damage-inducible protein DinB